ncbi:Clathrin light chain 2 [Vitis vinifera]|uniref:Clathrin light chain 2 n=1 Tax=Vitis vinifera TaxID=29760 RepID=A0A438E9W9_VITVI|nr:Clathrin light chain 2 [Vitis vinifera]
MLEEIIKEADEYKVQLYRRRQIACETNKATDREQLFEANQDMFHAEAEKNYWRAIMELSSNEVPATEKRRRNDNEKKPSVIVIQGPSPGSQQTSQGT